VTGTAAGFPLPIIQRCYSRFLVERNDPEDCEYPDDADQIREVLIHENYLSQKDIELCAAFDISEHEELEMHTNFPGIESLHQTLRATYCESEAAATS
jgi:TFIIF-interacting CTD phosphatase-like protein